MKLLLFPVLTFFCNPGMITEHNTNQKFLLKCEEPECNYTIDLKTGSYTYITENKEDTVTFIVTEDLGVFLLKRTDNKPFLFEIIH